MLTIEWIEHQYSIEYIVTRSNVPPAIWIQKRASGPVSLQIILEDARRIFTCDVLEPLQQLIASLTCVGSERCLKNAEILRNLESKWLDD